MEYNIENYINSTQTWSKSKRTLLVEKFSFEEKSLSKLFVEICGGNNSKMNSNKEYPPLTAILWWHRFTMLLIKLSVTSIGSKEHARISLCSSSCIDLGERLEEVTCLSRSSQTSSIGLRSGY